MSTPARVPERPPLRDGRVPAPRGASLGRTTRARLAGTTDLEAPSSGTEWGRLLRGCGGLQTRRDVGRVLWSVPLRRRGEHSLGVRAGGYPRGAGEIGADSSFPGASLPSFGGAHRVRGRLGVWGAVPTGHLEGWELLERGRYPGRPRWGSQGGTGSGAGLRCLSYSKHRVLGGPSEC